MKYTTDRSKLNSHYRLQLLIFLLVWPASNTLFALAVNHDIGMFALLPWKALLSIAIKSWSMTSISLLVITLLEWLFARWWIHKSYALRLLMHTAVIAFVFTWLYPLIPNDSASRIFSFFSLPFIVVSLELSLYIAIMFYVEKQQQAYQLQLSLAHSELNAVRAQHNPHFLFNTLNMIATEIGNSPNNARELVYQLADLMRITMKLSQREFTSVEEEIQLASHYLKLQQQRFRDRLNFTIQIDPETTKIPLPSLLVLPVVENAIKHGVAPYREAAHISVKVSRTDKQVILEVQDTGPPFDPNVGIGNGLRILRETLHNHYRDGYTMQLLSQDDGGLMRLQLPILQHR